MPYRIADKATDQKPDPRKQIDRFQSQRYAEVVSDYSEYGDADTSRPDGETGHEAGSDAKVVRQDLLRHGNGNREAGDKRHTNGCESDKQHDALSHENQRE